jgi:hypothetical protein
VKVLLDIVYGLLVGGSVILIILILITILRPVGSGLPLTASVPVAVGLGDDPSLPVEIGGAGAQGIRAAFVDETEGMLRLETTSWRFVLIGYSAQLLAVIGLAYVFYLLRTVFQTILKGETFMAGNTRQIHRVGYTVLLLGFLRPAVEYLAAKEILEQVRIVEPALRPPSSFRIEVILAGLLILVLAQIWRYGSVLEREQALTI